MKGVDEEERGVEEVRGVDEGEGQMKGGSG